MVGLVKDSKINDSRVREREKKMIYSKLKSDGLMAVVIANEEMDLRDIQAHTIHIRDLSEHYEELRFDLLAETASGARFYSDQVFESLDEATEALKDPREHNWIAHANDVWEWGSVL